MYGNFHIFPKPIAEPVTARIKVTLEDQRPCSDFRSLLEMLLLIYFKAL
jgi:hypothetical protein